MSALLAMRLLVDAQVAELGPPGPTPATAGLPRGAVSGTTGTVRPPAEGSVKSVGDAFSARKGRSCTLGRWTWTATDGT
jgi:hypothetical protein